MFIIEFTNRGRMPDYNYYYTWGNNEKRKTLKGRRCRVLHRAPRMNSCLIEFEDGTRECVSRFSVRLIKPVGSGALCQDGYK